MLRLSAAIFWMVFLALAGPAVAHGQETDTTRPGVDPAVIMWPENLTFQTAYRKDSVVPKSLGGRIRSTAYFKNNEFKNNFVTGTSLIGIHFEPVLEYHPDSRTTIRAGANLLKYHGANRFERAVPVLSLQHDASDHFSLIFGTLSGTVNHNLIEPVRDFQDYLIDNYENGLQLLWNYPQFRSDLWLNWEQFLKKGDPFQEKFTAGSNSTFKLYESDLFQITAPLTILFRHQGGEIDATNLPATTQMNLVQGLRFNWLIGDSFFKSVSLAQNYVQFVEINPGQQVTVPYGNGSYSRCFVDTRLGSFEVGYWKAYNFISPHGMPAFQSVSREDPAFLQSERQLLVLKYEFDYDLTRFLKIAIRFEPYYYYDTGRVDHSWSIYLVLDDDFLIVKSKKS